MSACAECAGTGPGHPDEHGDHYCESCWAAFDPDYAEDAFEDDDDGSGGGPIHDLAADQPEPHGAPAALQQSGAPGLTVLLRKCLR